MHRCKNNSAFFLKWGSPTWCIQGGSNMTGTNCDFFTHKYSRSYLNHLVLNSLVGRSDCCHMSASSFLSFISVSTVNSPTLSFKITKNISILTTAHGPFAHPLRGQKMSVTVLVAAVLTPNFLTTGYKFVCLKTCSLGTRLQIWVIL
jgi:hypothetical protein